MTFEGAACGVLLNPDTFDVFVFTTDTGSNGMDIMFLKNVPINPNYADAVPILSSPQQEDNPHIERLPNGDLLLLFDRDRFIYYTLSSDNGNTWTTPTLITNVINDHAPYDIQPHLWYDGTDWWVYFVLMILLDLGLFTVQNKPLRMTGTVGLQKNWYFLQQVLTVVLQI